MHELYRRHEVRSAMSAVIVLCQVCSAACQGQYAACPFSIPRSSRPSQRTADGGPSAVRRWHNTMPICSYRRQQRKTSGDLRRRRCSAQPALHAAPTATAGECCEVCSKIIQKLGTGYCSTKSICAESTAVVAVLAAVVQHRPGHWHDYSISSVGDAMRQMHCK